MNDKTIASVS